MTSRRRGPGLELSGSVAAEGPLTSAGIQYPRTPCTPSGLLWREYAVASLGYRGGIELVDLTWFDDQVCANAGGSSHQRGSGVCRIIDRQHDYCVAAAHFAVNDSTALFVPDHDAEAQDRKPVDDRGRFRVAQIDREISHGRSIGRDRLAKLEEFFISVLRP